MRYLTSTLLAEGESDLQFLGLAQSLGPVADHRLIAVVPVRETEAWLLCDSEALSALVGADPAAAPQRPADVERLGDPKAVLKTVLGGRASEYARDRLAQSVRLDRLALVPAYQTFLADLTSALKELHFL